jgi:predicted heme/steroid binding protein
VNDIVIRLTLKELSYYNGLGGRKAYIAYEGKIYDVSDSFLWQGGKHQVLHKAGEDLTEALNNAPHGEDLLIRVKCIGELLND